MLISILVLIVLTSSCGLGLAWASRFRLEPDPLAAWINALLPQTQCGRCGHPGCQPYAEAITRDKADINQCPPGGEDGIIALASLLARAPKALDPEHGKLQPHTVVIDEERCIGCTLCIKACPVDAIIGAPKLMHTVIESECTSCELCLPPCPVDCIDVIQPPAANHPSRPIPKPTAKACIQCGDCISVCPASLWPQQLYSQIRQGSISQAERHGLSACIECGDCETICPSHIPLLGWFRFARIEQTGLVVEKNAQQLSRKRFMDRNARLERMEAERTERLRKRKQALKNKTTQQDRIRASIARAKQTRQAEGNGKTKPTSH